MHLDGIHHISSTTGDAPATVDFYGRVLGLRLVAKTVNQDDPSVYHLFFADERGRAGAELTFFEYPGARPGRAGDGMVHTIVHRVGSPDALDFWTRRLAAEGVETVRTGATLTFADHEGLRHELTVADATLPDTPLVAEDPDVPAEYALQGFAGVRAYASDPARSGAVLEGLMGATRVAQSTWELRGARRGGFIAYDAPPAQRGIQGAGAVHHVAWGTTHEDYDAWLETLRRAGVPNSGAVDRHYFQSIYFREPSGVLFELATDGPGFTVDGLGYDELGSRIILPPHLEAHRERVEAILTPLPDPRAGRVSA